LGVTSTQQNTLEKGRLHGVSEQPFAKHATESISLSTARYEVGEKVKIRVYKGIMVKESKVKIVVK
jgi:hypothetical protein